MTMNKIYGKLRAHGRSNYVQFLICAVLSITLVTSFAVMVFSPTVQNVFPEGGDSRTQLYMIFAIALVGCFIFSLYAASIFMKYKTKQTGVFLALGAQRGMLSRTLIQEIFRLTLVCAAAGLVLGGLVSFGVWQVFRMFIVDTEQMAYHFSIPGYGIGLAFAAVSVFAVTAQAYYYMKKTSVMDILYEQRKNEPLKPVTGKYAVSGVILMVFGVAIGSGAGIITATMFERQAPAWFSAFYLLSLVGIYRIITYAVSQGKRGKNPQQYYKHIISTSMMKFQGRQTVRNMCVVAMMLTASLFSMFYPAMLAPSLSFPSSNVFEFSISYNLSEDELNREDLYEMAKRHDVTITRYDELVFTELIGSGVNRDWNDDGEMTSDYYERFKYLEFISISEYNALMGSDLEIQEGSYLAIKPPNQSDNIFKKYDDMDYAENPVTGTSMRLIFAGTEDCQDLIYNGAQNNGTQRYILNDSDYALLSRGITPERQVLQILFNIANPDAAFPFAKEIYREFIARASEKMAYSKYHNEYEENLFEQLGLRYDYSTPIELRPDNPDLMEYWKYYPLLKPYYEKTSFQNYAVFIMTFFYVAVISLVAVGIFSYTRSVTIGMTNKRLFDDLRRLGANKAYITKCVTKQMNKIFIVPLVIAAILMYAFALYIMISNNGRITGTESVSLIIDIGIGLLLCLYQYLIYRASLRKVSKTLGNL